MPFKFLPDVALADVAFEASAASLSGLFEECAAALTSVMVDRATLRATVERRVQLRSETVDTLLYDFLTQLIVMKDVDSLLFKTCRAKVDPRKVSLSCSLRGEPIDRERHRLRNDVKAVTMHLFGVSRARSRWKAVVVLDI